MKKKLITLFSLLALGTGLLHAQTGVWYFGNGGGLQFTNTGTNPIAGSPINTSEGCAGVVDALNNVEFYTDGANIWNGNHVNQSGTAGTLAGTISSSQTALIIPVPDQTCNNFFIFTTQSVENNYGVAGVSDGLRVSLATVTGTAPSTTVTITTANRNQLINTGGALMSERLTAVSDGNGGYWVLAHGCGTYGAASFGTPLNTLGEGNFYRVHVTNTTTTIGSLTATAINFPASTHRSCIHPYLTTNGSSNIFYTQGQMKLSADGRRLAVAMGMLREVQLYDFNQSTGAITNQVLITNFAGTEATVYGVEFSPNGDMLYVATTYAGSTKNVYQFDLLTNVRTTLATSTTNYNFGHLQLGPDQRIYVARQPNNTTTVLDVIQSPNTSGTGCTYVSGGVTIAGQCRLGLPTVLVNNPCEGNGGPTGCVCNSSATITGSTLLKDGTGTATLALNSGTMLVRRLKITLVNFTQSVTPECLKCEMNAASQFGTITNTPVVNTVTGVLAPATTNGVASWSKQISWTLTTPAVVNGSVTLNLRFPGVLNLSCCANKVDYCFNVEYIDADCNICENTTCTSTGSPQALKLNDEQPANEMVIPSAPAVKPETGNKNDIMQLFPNPTGGNVTVELAASDLGGKIQVFNSNGTMVQSQRCEGPVTVISTGNLPNGLYMITYESNGTRVSQQLLVQH